MNYFFLKCFRANSTINSKHIFYKYEAYENLIGEPRLELKVVTLNINEGHNNELMEQCQILREYAQYVARVRKYTKEMEFLRKNKSEVIAMSIFEYDKEEEEKKLRKAEFEAGEESKAKEIIGLMLSAGEPVEKIAQYTGYTIEEIQKSSRIPGEKRMIK